MALDRPPSFSRTDARDAASWILTRRQGTHDPGRRDQDPDLERFPDPDDLLAVVEYVSAHQRVAADVLRDDALGQLVILDYLQSELDRRRLAAIRLARAPDASRVERKSARRTRPHGLTWAALAPALRVGTPQGAEQLYLRLVNALEGDEARGSVRGKRDERQARATRTRAADAKIQDAERNSAVRAFLTLALNEAARLPPDLVDDLLAVRGELEISRHSEPVSRAMEALACTTVRQILASQVDGRLQLAVHHIAPMLGLNIERQQRLIKEGLLEGVVEAP